MAKLYFRYGAMNCGKSTALIQVAHNYEERGMRVVIVKPEVDTKGDNSVVSRMGTKRTVDILASQTTDLYSTVLSQHKQKAIGCLLVDEAQFLQPSQVDQLFQLVVINNIPVIAYGLRSDFLTNSFPGSRRLFELAHSVEELKTICRCGKKALFNGRKVNGNFIFSGAQVAIDGAKKIEYESLCASCYFQERSSSESRT